mmetsp:Transcript_21950/g.21140  ORF Transcript_21950/g.21140 Transcript_21950/m.21140 type:complete len:169 (+) Transcript_21950:2821-3327(+)
MSEYTKVGENEWKVQRLFPDGKVQMEYRAILNKSKAKDLETDVERDYQEVMIDQTIFYKNGQKAKVEVYKEGKPVGKTVFYGEDGKEMGSCTFTGTKKHGKYFEFDNASNLVAQHSYLEGELSGESVYFYSDGKKRMTKKFSEEMGKCEKIHYFRDGVTVQSKKIYNE